MNELAGRTIIGRSRTGRVDLLDLQSMLFSIPGAAERPLVGEFQCHHPAVLDGTVGRQAGKCRRGGLAWLGRYLGV